MSGIPFDAAGEVDVAEVRQREPVGVRDDDDEDLEEEERHDREVVAEQPPRREAEQEAEQRARDDDDRHGREPAGQCRSNWSDERIA